LVVIACGPAPGPPRARKAVVDLVERFASAEGGSETVALDLADRRVRVRLDRGWSDPETLPDGTPVVVATGRLAGVQIDLHRPVDRTLVVRCGRLGDDMAARPTRIAVLLNRRRVGVLAIGTGLADYRLRLPEAFQQPGRNELTFSGPARRRVGGSGIAYQAIRLEGPPRLAGPRLDGDAIVFGAGDTLRFVVRVPPAGALSLGVDPPGTGLVVTVEPEDGAGDTVGLATGEGGTQLADLAPWDGQVVRLAVAAPGASGPVRAVAPRLLGADPSPPVVARSEPTRFNVLVVLIDTLRADHLGAYGYDRPTSPHIDALARDGVLFEEALAQASWTRPATASIMTGVDPPVHGAVGLRYGFRPDVPTLAEALHAAGYATAAFVTNVNVAGRFGFARGFDRYEYLPEDENSPTLHVSAEVLVARARAWLDGQDPARPFFLYLHATDPHAPYAPPDALARTWVPGGTCGPEARRLLEAGKRDPTAIGPEQRAVLIGCYDAEIAYTDAQVGVLIDDLARRHLLDRTVVVVVADHGEEFLDHQGFEHGRTLFEEQLRIPLVIRFPDASRRGRRVAARARQIDVLPTVLDSLGLPIPAEVRGRSLLGAIDANEPAGAVDSYAQTRLGARDLESLTTERWKVVQGHRQRDLSAQAFDLARDPEERIDRLRERPLLGTYARESLAAWLADLPRSSDPAAVPAAPPEADAETLRRLRALGYVE
jgi:arylsulfatase A-like enzyme